MIRWPAVAALIAIALPWSARQHATQDPPRQVFRSATSAVAVDVTVREGRRAVTGLGPSDFLLYDNGVLQKVDTVSYGKLPIDVTIALDVSHSVTGALLDRLRRAVVQMMNDLRAEDRLKLVLFNMRVARVADFTRDAKGVEAAIRNTAAGGGTSLRDAISVALVSSAPADRRQLIVAFTDGSDSVSITSEATLTEVARRTRATVTFVVPTTQPNVPIVTVPGARITPGLQVLRTMPPHQRILASLAEETGGHLMPVSQGENISAAFRRTLEEFRSTYVLYFRPTGVDASGYHTLEVKTTRERAEVHARRGYFGAGR